MISFFGGLYSTITFFFFLFVCFLLVLVYVSYKESKRKESTYYSQKYTTDKPSSTTRYTVPEKPVYYGNASDFIIRDKTQYHYSFPIIPEGAEDRRLELRSYMETHNLLIMNPDYYDVPNSMNYFSDVYQYHKTYIQGRLEGEDDSYFADEEEYEIVHRKRYKVYASLDGKNWIDIGYAPQGKMWDSDFYDGMFFDVQISGGYYKHMVNDKVKIDKKPYWFYGYFL